MDLVVCSLEAWDEVWRRNQYLLDALLRQDLGLRVLFVEPARDAWRRGPRPAPGPRAVAGRDRLWLLEPTKPLPRVVGPWADLALTRQVRRAAARLGFDAPVLWLNDLMHTPLMTASGWPTLYDVTDDWLLETTVPPRVLERRRRHEARVMERAAEVVVCSPALAASRGAGRPVTLLRNGVDVELMTTPQPRPEDLGDAPVAVYVGTLHADRTDVDLLVRLAGEVPDLGIALVGPDALPAAERARLSSLPGVRLLGARPHDQVPGYLQHADVVIVPHLVNAFTDSLDPIKAHECLAIGSPTVATPVAGFREHADTMTIVDREGFCEAVRRALAAPGRAVPQRSAVSWSARADELHGLLVRSRAGRGQVA